MKQQKTKTTSKLKQASTLLNKIDDSNLEQVVGGVFGYTNPDPNRPESEKQVTRAV
jgi:hypothetical protein